MARDWLRKRLRSTASISRKRLKEKLHSLLLQGKVPQRRKR